MSPLKKGSNTVRYNVAELMQPPQSASRKKAIATIARRNNISLKEAQFLQAQRIAQAQARKK